MKLFELFDKPQQDITSNGFAHSFYIDGDGPYTVYFAGSSASYQMFIKDDEIAEWVDSEVPDRDAKVYGMGFYYKSSGEITGIHDPYKVFATVLDIARKFIAKQNADFIAFEAKSTEPSRVKLYHRLAKTLGKDYRFYDDVEGVIFVVRV